MPHLCKNLYNCLCFNLTLLDKIPLILNTIFKRAGINTSMFTATNCNGMQTIFFIETVTNAMLGNSKYLCNLLIGKTFFNQLVYLFPILIIQLPLPVELSALNLNFLVKSQIVQVQNLFPTHLINLSIIYFLTIIII